MARWLPLAVLVAIQIAYPLITGSNRALLVIATVGLGWAISVGHALTSRGPRVAARLLAITTVGGFVVEVVGVASGFPFGRYEYLAALGPRWLGVPLVIPLAWTWMAWPAWVSAGRLTRARPARIGLAAIGLAGWDLFLDPQMVQAGYWRWAGTNGVPLTNYAGWFAVSLTMMALLSRAEAGPAALSGREPVRSLAADAPMYALFLWTYGSSLLAHAVFLHLPTSALWGGLGMGIVAVPLAVRLARP